MTEKEMLHNQIMGEETVYFDRTITVLCDERPGFDIKEARRIINHLREHGYYVVEMDVDRFLKTNDYYMGFLLIIPHASSLPAVCSTKVRHFMEYGGSVLTFGGVLFGKCVEKKDGKWQEIPLPDHIFDAVHTGDGTKAKAERIVIEGIVPTYKTYRCNAASEFRCNSLYTDAKIVTEEPLQVVCPVPRSYGGGYQMEFRNRYIPIAEIEGKSDRGDGCEGAAAFIMLNDTQGHNPIGTCLVYPGTVACTAMGSVAANIGIMKQNLMDIQGVPELLCSIVENLRVGLHIQSGGADKYVYRNGEKAVFGAKVHNSSIEYEFVTVRIRVQKQGMDVYGFEEEIMCGPRCYNQCRFECPDFVADEYTVKTELIYKDRVIDEVLQEIHAEEEQETKDYVRTEGENFKLGDKIWYPAGMNYWPLYMPGFERTHYWLGWLDKSNYIPEEVEKDIVLMEKMGINCLFLRFDGDILGRQREAIKDFIWRIKKHHMKLSISICNVTMPIHYNPKAFRKIISELSLCNDPVIFSFDISWESDGALLATPYKKRYDEEWEKWLVERYGSIENAEADFGVQIERRADGQVTVPEESQFAEDGNWRVKICAYRRFMEDYFGKLWKDAVTDMRRVVPNHLISYRRGPMGDHAKGTKIAVKYTDYNSHEAYHIGLGEKDYHRACADAALFEWLSKNKPTIWSEYGLTLTGMNRTNDFVWDHEKERPAAFRMKMTEEYNLQMQKVFERTNAKGTAPWWWPGGLRMVEMSDCGYCEADGTLRPFGKDYAKFIKEYYTQSEKKRPERYMVKIDIDKDSRGAVGLCRDYLAGQDIIAEQEGKVLQLYTEATGTNSATVPLTAVGNVPYNGSNPPKYLNGEFNAVYLYTEDGEKIEVKADDCVELHSDKIYIEAEVGNLKEAQWLSAAEHSEKKGCVYMVSHPTSELELKLPISKDTPYLEDVLIKKELLCEGINGQRKVALWLQAENRACFGEVFRFTLNCKKK